MIHQDDLADLILRVAKKGSAVAGSIFDAANVATESVDDFLDKLVRVSGAQGGYSYIEPSNGELPRILFTFVSNRTSTAYEEALQTTSLIRPYLGNALLGWVPQKPSLVDGLETYYASWKASEGL
jgi:nucleoside-diphosphate-sugar epimerase